MRNSLTFQLAETKENIEKAARIILKHRLHLVYGQMSNWAKGFRKTSAIVICRKNGKPIAAGMNIQPSWDRDPNIGIFVKSSHRRKGIGTEVFKRLAEKVPSSTIKFASGEDFYNRMKHQTDKPMEKMW